MKWLKEEKLDEVRDLLKHQKLKMFLKLSGNTYPDLVKVFLTNMWYDDDTIYSQVKGVDMAINDEVWLVVAGLRNAGVTVGRGNTTDLGEFNKVQLYKSCLRNEDTATRTFSVGGLAVTPRILAYIVIWLLTPRGFNHVVLTEEDLILMYCLMSITKVNWVNVIKEHIFKINKKPWCRIPYVVLISNFIKYYEIDVEEEVVEEVKALNEISTPTLNKIGLKKVNNCHWVYKANGDSAYQEEDGVGTSAANADAPAGDGISSEQFAYMADIPLTQGEETFSRFEQMMINQLHTIENDHRSHHQLCETRF